MKQVNWADHIVNFITVLLSISIAFWLDGYRSDLKERKIEQRNMVAMLVDLKEDAQILDSLVTMYAEAKVSAQKLIDANLTYYDYRDTTQNIYKDWRKVMGLYAEPFSPRNITYESMRSSGRLDLISNPELKAAIINLNYKTYGNNMWERERWILEREEKKHERLDEVEVFDEDAKLYRFQQPGFNRYLSRERGFYSWKAEDYKKILDECNQLISMINEEFELE